MEQARAAIGQAMTMTSFELDGQPITARPGETILKAAQRHGVEIPHLCYSDGLRPDGNCRACVVEIAGERTLAPSCCRAPTEGMKVQAASPRARKSQQMVVEMLLSDMPDVGYRWNDQKANTPELIAGSAYPSSASDQFDSKNPETVGQHGELSDWADRLGVAVRPALQALRREQPAPDLSHPPMAESTCVACGECVQACPTGALSPKTHVGSQKVDRKVDSVCPFCGVGCLITYNVRDEKIISVEGRDGPANHGRLCVKGRFGFDYAHHPDRLTVPLIRKPGVPKEVRPYGADWRDTFREATWEEALDLAAGALKALRDTHGPKALAGFGSAKGSNEEAYLFQKLVRTGFGSNNVDHCTRLCRASSVAALLEGVGAGAGSNPVNDMEQRGHAGRMAQPR